MTAPDFDAEQAYADDRFSSVEVARSDRMKVVRGYSSRECSSPGSDVAIHVRSGTGHVRDGEAEQDVEPGDVVVDADTERGVRADTDSRLEALLVTAPPTTNAEHDPVRRGLQRDEIDPTQQ